MSIINELDLSIKDFTRSNHLSARAQISLFQTLILRADLNFAMNLLENPTNVIQKIFDELIIVQSNILEELKIAGEEIELFADKQKSIFDNLTTIKNIFNPFLHLLVHVKLRLGSLLMLKATFLESGLLNFLNLFKHAPTKMRIVSI